LMKFCERLSRCYPKSANLSILTHLTRLTSFTQFTISKSAFFIIFFFFFHRDIQPPNLIKGSTKTGAKKLADEY
jgi:hypothetical protein